MCIPRAFTQILDKPYGEKDIGAYTLDIKCSDFASKLGVFFLSLLTLCLNL